MKYGTIAGTTLVKKEKEASKLRMAGGAWSINLDHLPELINGFAYVTEDHKYHISRADAFEHGFIRYMQAEKKLIVPLKHWKVSPR